MTLLYNSPNGIYWNHARTFALTQYFMYKWIAAILLSTYSNSNYQGTNNNAFIFVKMLSNVVELYIHLYIYDILLVNASKICTGFFAQCRRGLFLI